MNIEELMHNIYNLQRMDEFKDLCSKLQTAAHNVYQYQLGQIPLPNPVFRLHRAAT